MAARPASPSCSSGGLLFEAADQLVEAELLERVADRAELARAQLDQGLALADEREGLAQARLAGVQPADDLLDASCRRLVALRLGRLLARRRTLLLTRRRAGPPWVAHRSRILASRTPSENLSRTSSASPASPAVPTPSPPPARPP